MPSVLISVTWAGFLASALATFHHGIDATPVPLEVEMDDSFRTLDDAVAEGRGAVITSPHWSGHELMSALVNRKHPMTLLVRQASSAERMARKLKWYKALGAEIVLRPSHASTIKDAVAYLNVLKRGRVLAITPDLLADAPQGVDARMFGRAVRLHGGAFAIALAARAPMIRPYLRWQSELRVVAVWERAPELPATGDREAAVSCAVQDWCNWFERKLRANPENWLFWLDKRWSRFLRATPRACGAE